MNLNPIQQPTGFAGVINNKIWYRAIAWAYRRDPLSYSHTWKAASRYNRGNGSFPMLYLAPDPLTALLEIRALIHVPGFPSPIRIKSLVSYAVVPVRVTGLKTIIDFGDPSQRKQANTTAQELTGDWRTYGRHRHSGKAGTVRSSRRAAPTQELGLYLYRRDPKVEGFLAPAAVSPTVANLVLFPDRLHVNRGQLRIEGRQSDEIPLEHENLGN